MKQIRKIIALLMLVSLFATPTVSFAADDTLREVFTDAAYGAASGALVGGAFMIFQKKPLDNFSFMAYGAGAGIMAGTAYGMAKSARAFAQVENGNFRVAFPTIIPDLVVSPSTRQTTVAWKADLFRGTFN